MAIELLFLLLLAYLFFGPKELPVLARKVGKLVAQINQAKAELQGRIEREVSDLDLETKAANPAGSNAQTGQSG